MGIIKYLTLAFLEYTSNSLISAKDGEAKEGCEKPGVTCKRKLRGGGSVQPCQVGAAVMEDPSSNVKPCVTTAAPAL